MQNTAKDVFTLQLLEELSDEFVGKVTECDIVEFRIDHELLFENFSYEIDSWARRALAANGFGDY